MEKENIYLNRIFNKHERQEREQYPFSIPVIANFKELVFNKSVTYIGGLTVQENPRCSKQLPCYWE